MMCFTFWPEGLSEPDRCVRNIVHFLTDVFMNQFIAFVQKEFYHIFRDKRTIMILLGMPVIQIILFGFAITTEVKNTRLAVYDPSKDVMTQRIVERFAASEYFRVERVFDYPQEIEKAFRKGEVDLVIVFGEHFSERLLHTGDAVIQLVVDATDPNTSTILTGYATGILSSFQQEQAEAASVPYRIVPEVKLLYNPQMKSAYNFVPGVMGLIFMLICAMMTSISIVREKETGTMEILLVSPLKPLYIIIAKAIPYFVLSCANLATILLLSVYVLHVPVAGSFLGLMLVSLLFILVSLALGLLISNLVKTQVAAMLISGMALMMPVILLSGMIFPIEGMPRLLQGVSSVIPARWYIAAVKKLMIEGLGISAIFRELLILSGIALLLITVSLKKFKNRLE